MGSIGTSSPPGTLLRSYNMMHSIKRKHVNLGITIYCSFSFRQMIYQFLCRDRLHPRLQVSFKVSLPSAVSNITASQKTEALEYHLIELAWHEADGNRLYGEACGVLRVTLG